MKGKSVLLRKRPSGAPEASDFEIVEHDVREPFDEDVMVQNLFMSVDPYMRGRMRATKSYAANFEVGDVMSGGAVGRVEKSGNSRFKPGDYVLSNNGWREWFVCGPSELKKIEPEGLPPQSFLGIMGMPGRTAYFGLLEIGAPKPGETVFVSSGAGAVGSAVCQIAKIKGARVVASAGTQAKIRWLIDEAGVDEAINHRETRNLGRSVRKSCPDGIDVYFDNVGGDHLQAALSCMNAFGRVVACGMISRYNDARPVPGPNNLATIVGQRLKIQGFIISDHPEIGERCESDYRLWIQEGRLKWKETIVEGIDKAPEAFIGLFTGENFGKMIIKLA
jgi:NADPH-dependent curcumin reductase CurA